MTEFNPLAGAILSSTVTQAQSADAKRLQVSRSQLLRSNSAPTDTFEPHVESVDELHPVDDRQKENSGQRNPRRPRKPAGATHDSLEHDHVDLCG